MQTTISESDIERIEREKLEDFHEGNYIDIEEGQTRTLEFNLNKVKVEDKTDMFGNPIKKVQYKVRDVERSTIQTEKIFELTRKHSAKIYNELKKGGSGAQVLQVTRKGKGINTEYEVKRIQ